MCGNNISFWLFVPWRVQVLTALALAEEGVAPKAADCGLGGALQDVVDAARVAQPEVVCF